MVGTERKRGTVGAEAKCGQSNIRQSFGEKKDLACVSQGEIPTTELSNEKAHSLRSSGY